MTVTTFFYTCVEQYPPNVLQAFSLSFILMCWFYCQLSYLLSVSTRTIFILAESREIK